MHVSRSDMKYGIVESEKESSERNEEKRVREQRIYKRYDIGRKEVD